jgi:ATP-dependent protease ClpP protease subunit
MSKSEASEITLYGTVGESFWGEQSFTASSVRDALRASSGDVMVRINSGGGIATEGQAIYNLLRDHPGSVHVVIDGIAASAASLIAMAGDTITMRDGAVMMIHDPAQPWVEGRGTEADHQRAARTLSVLSGGYASVYARRSGMTAKEAREVMKAETYMDGATAVAMGFATDTDEELAQAFAAFDYAAYAHAPKELLDAGAGLARRNSSRRAVAALMAGINAPMPKGTIMADKNETTDDDLIEAASGDDTMAAVEEEETITAEADEDEKPVVAPAASAVAVLNLARIAGMSLVQATELVSSGMSLEQVAAHLAEKKAKGNPMTGNVKPGGPSTQILRDERDTRRAGMEGALIARMSRARDVTGPARDFMDLTLAEMALASVGQRGRPARGGGELRAIEMAFSSHSTSDLPAILENAMNKRMAAAYEAYTPTYRAIAERIDFTDFRAHPISNIGNWPMLEAVAESGEIKYGSVSDKKETVALIAYAKAFSITRQMLVNDDLGGIERMLASRGQSVAAFEDQTFFAMLLSGANSDGPTLLETTRQVFNTTDGTKAGTPSVINPANIALGYAAMSARKSLAAKAADQMFIKAEPRFLLTGPAKQFEAAQLLAPIQAAQASDVNPYVGKLQPIMAPHITGNAWYLFAEPTATPCFMYGFLSGEAGPRMRMDEPFGMQGIRYSVELDFGCGATDFRGGWKNAGA